MKLLLSNATVCDVRSPYHGSRADILIEKGVIREIGESLSGARVINLNGALVTPGFCDLFAHFNDPGLEHRETLQSGALAARQAGFTDVCLIPNTQPVVASKADVKYIRSQHSEGVTLHAIAALSEDTKGENLTEMLDLQEAGAVAFSDGLNPVWNTELLLKALQYVRKFDGLIIVRPKDIHLSQFAQMHEGLVSTQLGMRGEPALSEELSIKRDLDILRYAGGRLHFTQISSARSVELIKAAKKEGLQVSCDVALHQLLYTDEALTDFDTNYKVDPPLRTEKDRRALLTGLKNDTIDAIVSAHLPLDTESKELEFDLATPGISALPGFFAALRSLGEELPLSTAVQKLTAGPRSILRMPEVSVQVGSEARLAVFDTTQSWVLDDRTNPSKSRNTPLFGQTLMGKCVGIVSGEFAQIKGL